MRLLQQSLHVLLATILLVALFRAQDARQARLGTQPMQYLALVARLDRCVMLQQRKLSLTARQATIVAARRLSARVLLAALLCLGQPG